MKLSQAIELFKAGKILVVGEYRGGVCEVMNLRDKATGGTRQGKVVKHLVELAGAQPCRVTEWKEDNYNPAEFKQPFSKGTTVLLMLDSLERMNGNLQARGTMEAVELEEAAVGLTTAAESARVAA